MEHGPDHRPPEVERRIHNARWAKANAMADVAAAHCRRIGWDAERFEQEVAVNQRLWRMLAQVTGRAAPKTQETRDLILVLVREALTHPEKENPMDPDEYDELALAEEPHPAPDEPPSVDEFPVGGAATTLVHAALRSRLSAEEVALFTDKDWRLLSANALGAHRGDVRLQVLVELQNRSQRRRDPINYDEPF